MTMRPGMPRCDSPGEGMSKYSPAMSLLEGSTTRMNFLVLPLSGVSTCGGAMRAVVASIGLRMTFMLAPA